ncbi:uncharacterized protein METZ01_LOCUS265178 [marine metagenome]|uniref:Uncharacterized protein n=1 Tax=marine metagenome TaxID=408172 RepID=A0A382JIY4_9ZZZZ
MEKMRQSDCTAQNGQIYYNRKTAEQAYSLLRSANK